MVDCIVTTHFIYIVGIKFSHSISRIKYIICVSSITTVQSQTNIDKLNSMINMKTHCNCN